MPTGSERRKRRLVDPPAGHRAAQAVLDEGAHAKVAVRWMAQVHRERANLYAQLGHTIPGGTLTSSQVRAQVNALRDIVTVLAEADPGKGRNSAENWE
jgi:hypothetical protein